LSASSGAPRLDAHVVIVEGLVEDLERTDADLGERVVRRGLRSTGALFPIRKGTASSGSCRIARGGGARTSKMEPSGRSRRRHVPRAGVRECHPNPAAVSVPADRGRPARLGRTRTGDGRGRVGADGTHGIARRVLLACICLVIAPILGVWAGGSMPNPPGNGPGGGQVAVGIAVPTCSTLIASVVARIRALEACIWALASLALTGGLILLLIWYVANVLRPV
jgi:hypothetical protein